MSPARPLSFIALCASLAAALWAETQPGTFKVLPVDAYPSRQALGKLKIAAVRYESDEDTRVAFGKVNPNEYGILPVLLVFENGSEETLLLERMKLVYQYPGTEIAPLPPGQLPYMLGPKRPNTGPKISSPIPLPKKKKPARCRGTADARIRRPHPAQRRKCLGLFLL